MPHRVDLTGVATSSQKAPFLWELPTKYRCSCPQTTGQTILFCPSNVDGLIHRWRPHWPPVKSHVLRYFNYFTLGGQTWTLLLRSEVPWSLPSLTLGFLELPKYSSNMPVGRILFSLKPARASFYYMQPKTY